MTRRPDLASMEAEAAAMHDPRVRQVALNAETRDHWNAFTGHRAKVTGLLATEPSSGMSRLCVLGAGNCNDLDLAALLRAALSGRIVLLLLTRLLPAALLSKILLPRLLILLALLLIALALLGILVRIRHLSTSLV